MKKSQMIMVYNEESHIRTIEEVRTFFDYIINERKCNFHPDDDFAEYVYSSDHSHMFSVEEIVCFNRLLEECFTTCEESNESIYAIGMNLLKQRLQKLRKD